LKYTVITGASSGIGYETALLFAARGKNLILVARRTEKLEELASLAKERSPEIDVVIRTADLSDMKQVHSLYEGLKSFDIETWINNAGLGDFGAINELDLNKIEGMLRLNIEALTILSSLYVRDYSNVEGTQIINVSSDAGYTIIGGGVTYSATKFYVSAFTEGLAHELKAKEAKLQAKILAPAATETEFSKNANDVTEFNYDEVLPKYNTAQEVAHFMLELYDNDKVLGIVNKNYEFKLRDSIYHYLGGF